MVVCGGRCRAPPRQRAVRWAIAPPAPFHRHMASARPKGPPGDPPQNGCCGGGAGPRGIGGSPARARALSIAHDQSCAPAPSAQEAGVCVRRRTPPRPPPGPAPRRTAASLPMAGGARGGGACLGPFVFRTSVVGGSLKSPPPPPGAEDKPPGVHSHEDVPASKHKCACRRLDLDCPHVLGLGPVIPAEQ